jgi:hypothetical protein
MGGETTHHQPAMVGWQMSQNSTHWDAELVISHLHSEGLRLYCGNKAALGVTATAGQGMQAGQPMKMLPGRGSSSTSKPISMLPEGCMHQPAHKPAASLAARRALHVCRRLCWHCLKVQHQAHTTRRLKPISAQELTVLTSKVGQRLQQASSRRATGRRRGRRHGRKGKPWRLRCHGPLAANTAPVNYNLPSARNGPASRAPGPKARSLVASSGLPEGCGTAFRCQQ